VLGVFHPLPAKKLSGAASISGGFHHCVSSFVCLRAPVGAAFFDFAGSALAGFDDASSAWRISNASEVSTPGTVTLNLAHRSPAPFRNFR